MADAEPQLDYDEIREKLLRLALERKRMERELQLDTAMEVPKLKKTVLMNVNLNQKNCASEKKAGNTKPDKPSIALRSTAHLPIDAKKFSTKVAFGSTVPKPRTNQKPVENHPVLRSIRTFPHSASTTSPQRLYISFARCQHILEKVGSYTRAASQGSILAAGAAMAIVKDESGTREQGIEAGILGASASRIVMLAAYPDDVTARYCGSPDLVPAGETFQEAMKVLLNVDDDFQLPWKPILIATVSAASLFVLGQKLELNEMILEGIESPFRRVSDVRSTLEECCRTWSSCRSLPFREVAMMACRTCFEFMGVLQAPSKIQVACAAALLSVSFNLARKQPLSINRGGLLVAILTSWRPRGIEVHVSTSGSNSSLSGSESKKFEKGFDSMVVRAAYFGVISASDEMWRRIREAFGALLPKTPVQRTVTITENPFMDCANSYFGPLKEVLTKAAESLGVILALLTKDRMNSVNDNGEAILKAVESGYFDIRRKVRSNQAPVDVVLEALAIDQTEAKLNFKLSHSKNGTGVSEGTNVVKKPGPSELNIEAQHEVADTMKFIPEEQPHHKESDDREMGQDRPPRRIRPITQRAPISVVTAATKSPTRYQTSHTGRSGSNRQRLFDDWTSESSSSWLSETGDLSPDEVRAFSSHLNDARSVAARYGIFQTTHPEDVERLLEQLPSSSRY